MVVIRPLLPLLVRLVLPLLVLFTLIQLAIGLAVVAANWKIFSKAGKPGWAAIIPIYNLVVWLEIVGRPTWWIAAIILCPPAALVMMHHLAC